MAFRNAYCVGNIQSNPGKSDLTVTGTITDAVDDGLLRYLAAAPPDYHSNYSGSALPFANPYMAFEDTPNKGVINLSGNTFVVKLLYPNSYYIGLGTTLVPPTLSLFYLSGGKEKTVNIKIAEEIPFRLLTVPKKYTHIRNDPIFYNGIEKLPIRTQEQILRSSAYPDKNITPDNFWGLKPPI